MSRQIRVIPYDPRWRSFYRAESELISSLLGPFLLGVHHIGSTAVWGLAAKPTIDLLGVVRSLIELDANNASLIGLGYQPKGENGIHGRRYFQKLNGDEHLFHLHAFEQGHPEIARHLLFRDYLRSHPDEAQAYQKLKLQLAARFTDDPSQYTSGKSALIAMLIQQAEAWQNEKRALKAGT